MANLTIENKVAGFTIDEQLCEDIVNESLEKLDKESNIIIELLFVDVEEIRELNNKYRNKNLPTDVLSFPQQQFDVEKNILGSIVICPEIAEARGESITELLKHGLLHLLGYDHETDDDEWGKYAKIIDCTF